MGVWELGTDFFDKTSGNLGLLLYPRKFQTKWSFTPGIFKICVTLFGISKNSVQDLWKFHMIFSLSPLQIPFPGLCNFHTLYFQYPCQFRVVNPSLNVFFWYSPFTQLHWQFPMTYIFPVSDEWLIFCYGNLVLRQKKKWKW